MYNSQVYRQTNYRSPSVPDHPVRSNTNTYGSAYSRRSVSHLRSHSALVCETAKRCSSAGNSVGNGLSTIERVRRLKRVVVFTHTPDDLLAEIALAFEEIDIKSESLVFTKGEAGNSMYVIASGAVRVHDGDQFFAILAENEVFGEMAILDQEPRMAFITTTKPTQLLQLSQQAFYQLVDQLIDIVRGIIKILNGRLRDHTDDIQILRTQLDQIESENTHRASVESA